jgi:hypothetical protein
MGDAFESPERLRAKGAEIQKMAALTSDTKVAAELIKLARTYVLDAARIERAMQRSGEA